MKILAVLPPREIEGADEVLRGAVVETGSGNCCRIWPAMTQDLAAHQTRVAFFTEWYRPATPDDLAELLAYTNELMGGPPHLLTESSSDPAAVQENRDWLRTGQMPKHRRTQ